MIELSRKHIVQSKEWGEIKQKSNTPPIRVGDLQFTKHKIPFIPYYVAYAPRVNFITQKFSWNELKTIAKSERCIFIRFDVPNVLNDNSITSRKIVDEISERCKLAPRSTFAKFNVLLDLTPTEEDLIMNISQKTRYNSRLSARKGVTVKIDNTIEGFEIFYSLLKETSERQKFLIHPKVYYKNIFEILNNHNMVAILVASIKNKPLSAWMLIHYQNTLYYPYGGSSSDDRNLMSSNLLAWEAIKYGKKIGCKLFDMWGATNDEKSTWWGFTKFKLGYGGNLVEYIDTYDFVVNKFLYFIFNLSYSIFWKLVDIIKRRK